MRIARRIVLSILAVGLALYLLILVWFWANQDRLVFFPERGKISAPPAYLGGEAKVARFSGESGKLTAWVIPPPAPADSVRWVLILHGNAGNLATPGRPEHDRQLHDMGLGVLAPDYRGYGESEGKPSEAGLYTDARTAYDFLRDSLRIPPNRIVIYGHSLGSAVATQLATSVEAAGLILRILESIVQGKRGGQPGDACVQARLVQLKEIRLKIGMAAGAGVELHEQIATARGFGLSELDARDVEELLPAREKLERFQGV
ncbi:MAG TPA: alpha/beta fold hydrolase, partial [Gemmatimonadales bacterium]|nr:alpha/beta fold hydrolase [Gemmatimonadales bacterium]